MKNKNDEPVTPEITVTYTDFMPAQFIENRDTGEIFRVEEDKSFHDFDSEDDVKCFVLTPIKQVFIGTQEEFDKKYNFIKSPNRIT